MKIDKIIFSCSEEYSDFWNINAQVWKNFLNIEPVCLLFGKKKNTNMSDEHGQIIEMPILPNLNKLLQLTWSKFWYTKNEPNTTWIIGDIDMIPLQREHFNKNKFN